MYEFEGLFHVAYIPLGPWGGMRSVVGETGTLLLEGFMFHEQRCSQDTELRAPIGSPTSQTQQAQLGFSDGAQRQQGQQGERLKHGTCRLHTCSSRRDTFGIDPPDTATLNTPRACTDSVAIAPIRRMSSVARASGLEPTSKVVVIVDALVGVSQLVGVCGMENGNRGNVGGSEGSLNWNRFCFLVPFPPFSTPKTPEPSSHTLPLRHPPSPSACW